MLTRMFSGMRVEASMIDVVRMARSTGVRTGLLSNSWGLDYERDGWDALFDAVVISGEVGLRKPDPAIYALAAQRLGLSREQIVFIDDLRPNVQAAAAAGMVGVQHVGLETTVSELEILFETRCVDRRPGSRRSSGLDHRLQVRSRALWTTSGLWTAADVFSRPRVTMVVLPRTSQVRRGRRGGASNDRSAERA